MKQGFRVLIYLLLRTKKEGSFEPSFLDVLSVIAYSCFSLSHEFVFRLVYDPFERTLHESSFR